MRDMMDPEVVDPSTESMAAPDQGTILVMGLFGLVHMLQNKLRLIGAKR